MQPPTLLVEDGAKGGQTVKVPTGIEGATVEVVLPSTACANDTYLVKIKRWPPPKGFTTWAEYSDGEVLTPYTFGEGPIGLVLEESTDTQGNTSVYVAKIVDGSPASKFETLKLNHVIKTINGSSTMGKDLEFVMQSLGSQPRPVTLEFASPTPPVLEPERTLLSFGEGPLGLEFIESGDDQTGLSVKILGLKPPPAAASKFTDVLSKDDVLVAMQGSTVRNLGIDEIISRIGSSTRPIELGFMPPPPPPRAAPPPPPPKAAPPPPAAKAPLVSADGSRVYIFEENSGALGIGLAMTVDEGNKPVPCIANIEPGQAADNIGTLKVCDYVLSVNDTPVLSMEMANTILHSPARPLKLCVRTAPKAFKLHLFGAGPMGLTLSQPTALQRVVVSEINPAGQAAAEFKTLRLGDSVVAIGAETAVGMGFEKVMGMLVTAARPVVLKMKDETVAPPPAPVDQNTFGYAPLDTSMFRPELFVANKILADKVKLNNLVSGHTIDPESMEEPKAEEQSTDEIVERTTTEKIDALMYCQPSMSLPSTYLTETMSVSLTSHAVGVCTNQVKVALRMQHKGVRGQRRMSSLLNVIEEDDNHGNWSYDSESKRAGQPFLSYIPARFLRTRLRAFDEFDPGEMLTSYHRYLQQNFNKRKITFLRLENLTLSNVNSEGLCSLVSQMPNVQCLILRKCNLSTTAQMVLPKLLYCDLRDNQIKAVEDLSHMIKESMYIQYLDLRGNTWWW